MGVDDVEPMRARDLHQAVGQREQVLRLAEHGIAGGLDAVKADVGIRFAQAKRRIAADDMRAMPAIGEAPRQLGRHHAAAADRRVTDDPDVHFSRCSRIKQLADDDALGKGDADERSELRIAALDQLLKARGIQPRRGRARRWRRKLRLMTGQRGALGVVVCRHVDDKRRPPRIVDEVIQQPVRTPLLARRGVARQAAEKRRAREQAARRDVIGMPIATVRNGDRPGPGAPNQLDDLRARASGSLPMPPSGSARFSRQLAPRTARAASALP